MTAAKKRRKDGRASVELSPTAAAIVYDGADLSDWDDEELLRGRRRNRNGTFTGRAPAVVPVKLVQELTRRRFSKTHSLLAVSLVDAVQVLREIVNDERASEFARLRAADMIFDRILGKPREQVAIDLYAEVEGKSPVWKDLTRNAIVGSASQALELLVEREREDELRAEMDEGAVEDA
jgi:hypothetical protein